MGTGRGGGIRGEGSCLGQHTGQAQTGPLCDIEPPLAALGGGRVGGTVGRKVK